MESEYNQIANFVYAQQEINIKIGKKAPNEYMATVNTQTQWGDMVYGSIDNQEELENNLRENCIPQGFDSMTLDDYPRFLQERRKLMAEKMKAYYHSL